MTVPISVSGGSGGIVANRDVIMGLAERCGATHEALQSEWWELVRISSGLEASLTGLVDPVGARETRDELAAGIVALQGAGGTVHELMFALLSAVTGYRWGADVFGPNVLEQVAGAYLRAGSDVDVFSGSLIATGSFASALGSLDEFDPGLTDNAVDVTHSVDLGLGLGLLQDDGHGRATATGVDTTGRAGVPPRSLADLVEGLAQRNATGVAGGIDVRIVQNPDGTRAVVVDITGTRSWSPHAGSDPADLTTDELALAGRDSAYEQGVLAAMRQAGVRPEDKVLLVGHSEGGMVAVNLARDATASGEFDVTHVITCGSPIGLTAGAVPASVQVLALENTVDAVPRLDGRPNPDRPNVTTVQGRIPNGTLGGDHDITGSYVPIAVAADGSADRSVLDFLDGAGFYLTGTTVTTRTFQVTRVKR